MKTRVCLVYILSIVVGMRILQCDKRLILKVTRFSGLVPEFSEVTAEKIRGGSFCLLFPFMNRDNDKMRDINSNLQKQPPEVFCKEKCS